MKKLLAEEGTLNE